MTDGPHYAITKRERSVKEQEGILMEEKRDKTAKNTFGTGIVVRLILFVFLSGLASTPLHIIVEGVIEGKHGAPEFVTVPFLIYAFCMRPCHKFCVNGNV